ncbi:unnamed protein product [Protopolystoma xenopodis]|uniref:Uncharacterized protein n=1 Tax=Protopolystoma xenopodis TaxID=117903 RepID=A0A448WY56_9PLAT|nr:unnamed protein product [Protopolystoma xenopodis]
MDTQTSGSAACIGTSNKNTISHSLPSMEEKQRYLPYNEHPSPNSEISSTNDRLVPRSSLLEVSKSSDYNSTEVPYSLKCASNLCHTGEVSGSDTIDNQLSPVGDTISTPSSQDARIAGPATALANSDIYTVVVPKPGSSLGLSIIAARVRFLCCLQISD